MTKLISSQPNSHLVVVVNLGSPHELSRPAIRSFLREFLSDQRVVGLPRLLWYPILYGIILPLRSKRLVHKYGQIWHSSGVSPLVYFTQQQALQLQARVELLADTRVEYAFCYGQRSLTELLAEMDAAGSTPAKLTIVPLYPQYSSSTTAAVFDQVSKFYQTAYSIPELRLVRSFATATSYIQALAGQIRQSWQQNGRAEHLLVSFHSIPVALVDKGDSYVNECQQTYTLLCHELGLEPQHQASLAFQSRFGRAKWVEPATDRVIAELAQRGVRTLDVICPGFVSDCLETLEEVDMMYREQFIHAGGTAFNYIGCLNDSSSLTDVLFELISK